MTNQFLLNLSHIATAVGIVFTAFGGYGAYYFQKKIDSEKEVIVKPIVDLCHRGIIVDKINDSTAHFNIPYCSGKNANAYNVKLESAIILKSGASYDTICPFGDTFPDGITLSYETGKAITYTLNPFSYDFSDIYICVKGDYTNEQGNAIFPVLDTYKYNSIENTWVRTLGEEDKLLREFIQKNFISNN